jgi:hypothetical protein
MAWERTVMDCGKIWMVDKVWKNITYIFLSLFFWVEIVLGRGVIFVDNGVDEWPVFEKNTDICISSFCLRMRLASRCYFRRNGDSGQRECEVGINILNDG